MLPPYFIICCHAAYMLFRYGMPLRHFRYDSFDAILPCFAIIIDADRRHYAAALLSPLAHVREYTRLLRLRRRFSSRCFRCCHELPCRYFRCVFAAAS